MPKVTLDNATAGATWAFKSQFNPNVTKNSVWSNGSMGIGGYDVFSTFGSAGFTFATAAPPNNPNEAASINLNPTGASLPVNFNYLYSFTFNSISVGAAQLLLYVIDGASNIVSNIVSLPINFAGPATIKGDLTVNLVGNNNITLVMQYHGDGFTTQSQGYIQAFTLYVLETSKTTFKNVFSVSPSNPYFTIVVGSPDSTDSGVAVIEFSNGGTNVGTLILPYGTNPAIPPIELGCSPPAPVMVCYGMNAGGTYALNNSANEGLIFNWSGICDTVTITIASGINSSGFKVLNNTVMGVLQCLQG